MVNRTISYEMSPTRPMIGIKKVPDLHQIKAQVIMVNMIEHMDIIRDLLLEYTYLEVDQIYDPTGTVAQGEAALNEGRSILNYTGHGSNGSFGNGCPMNNTDVNGLENGGSGPLFGP